MLLLKFDTELNTLMARVNNVRWCVLYLIRESKEEYLVTQAYFCQYPQSIDTQPKFLFTVIFGDIKLFYFPIKKPFTPIKFCTLLKRTPTCRLFSPCKKNLVDKTVSTEGQKLRNLWYMVSWTLNGDCSVNFCFQGQRRLFIMSELSDFICCICLLSDNSKRQKSAPGSNFQGQCSIYSIYTYLSQVWQFKVCI